MQDGPAPGTGSLRKSYLVSLADVSDAAAGHMTLSITDGRVSSETKSNGELHS
jgi:hypothetical protein